jgi:hypothetical protein
MREVLASDSVTGIGYLDREQVVSKFCGHIHPAARRSAAQRVVEEIAQHRPEPLRVGPKPRKVGRNM